METAGTIGKMNRILIFADKDRERGQFFSVNKFRFWQILQVASGFMPISLE